MFSEAAASSILSQRFPSLTKPLTDALNEAIDKEAQETNNQYVTDERQVAPILKEYDYDALQG